LVVLGGRVGIEPNDLAEPSAAFLRSFSARCRETFTPGGYSSGLLAGGGWLDVPLVYSMRYITSRVGRKLVLSILQGFYGNMDI